MLRKTRTPRDPGARAVAMSPGLARRGLVVMKKAASRKPLAPAREVRRVARRPPASE